MHGRARLARLALPYLDKPAGPVYRALLEEELARLTRLEQSSLEKLRQSLPAQRGRPAAPAGRNNAIMRAHPQQSPSRKMWVARTGF